MPNLFPLILITHITLAVGLFVPSLLLPFALRGGSPNRIARGLLAVQARGSAVIGAGLALTGAAMVLTLGPRILEQPWLLVSLATYAATAVVAFAVQRPAIRRFIGREAAAADLRRQRLVAYVMTGMVGLIGFLMSAKPELW